MSSFETYRPPGLVGCNMGAISGAGISTLANRPGRKLRSMITRVFSLTILFLGLLVAASSAQVLYDDGPINGTVDAWTINFGFVIGNSFTLLNNSTVGGFSFGVWEFAGDVLTSVD
jgi:hypothetical protein